MSAALKLLFDECCSPRLPRELRDFYQRDYPALQIRHLMDNWTAGTPYSQWLEALLSDPSWIVITKDAGKNSAQEKLPLICREWGIIPNSKIKVTEGSGQNARATVARAFCPQPLESHELGNLVSPMSSSPPGSSAKVSSPRKTPLQACGSSYFTFIACRVAPK